MPYFQVSTLTSSTVVDFRITVVSYIASYKPADSNSTQIPTYTDWHYIDWLLTLLFLLRIVKRNINVVEFTVSLTLIPYLGNFGIIQWLYS